MAVYEIRTGKQKQPFNIIVCGQQGLGKSTFGSQSPAPIFLGGEETGELDVSRMPQPKTYDELVSQIDFLIKEKGLGYKTVVLDTLDSVEQLLHKKIILEDPKGAKTMATVMGGYAKGYDYARDEFLNLRNKFKVLRDQFGMNLIFIAHVKKVNDNDLDLGEAFVSQELNLDKKAQALWVDWVSAVLYLTTQTREKIASNSDKVFVMSEGERVIRSEKRPHHPGKNRFNLPYEMPLAFGEFFLRYEEFFSNGPTPEAIIASIKGLIENIDDKTLVEKIMIQAKAAALDIGMLNKIEARVKEIVK